MAAADRWLGLEGVADLVESVYRNLGARAAAVFKIRR